jgi:hypothetical protein
MKNLFLGFLLLFPVLGFSVTYNSIQDGLWNAFSTWQGGNIPPANIPANTTIYINVNHDVTLNDLLKIAGNAKLVVCGNLTINGNVDVAANFDLVVCQGANFIVNGNFDVQPNGEFIIDGYAAVSGAFTYQKPPTIAPGILYVGDCNSNQLENQSTLNIICGTLPIELISYSPEVKPDRINLNWTTGSEINNDYFTIERSRDLYGWEVMGFVEGAGNSSVPIDYSFSDLNPLDGLAYYRLKQTDFDGAFKYYGPIAAHYDLGMEGLEFKVMKNYSNWVIAVPNDGIYQVEVYNL